MQNQSVSKCQWGMSELIVTCLFFTIFFISFYLAGERREEGSSLIYFFSFEFIFTSSIYIIHYQTLPTRPLKDAVQHCHQHQHHCIQRLGLRRFIRKQSGKKHVWNIKVCLRNLTWGIYETPLKFGMLLNDSGILDFIAIEFKEFIQSCFGFLNDSG